MRGVRLRCAAMAGALLGGALLAGSGGAAPMPGATQPGTSGAQRRNEGYDVKGRSSEREVAGRGGGRSAAPPALVRQSPLSQRSHGPAPPRPGTPVASVNALRLRSLLAAKAAPHLPFRHTAIRAAGGIGSVKGAMPIAGKTGVGKVGAGRSVAAGLPGVSSGVGAAAATASGARAPRVVALGGAAAGRATHAAVVDGSRMRRHPG